MNKKQIGIGVIVVLTKGDKILLGKRKNSIGHGTWSPAGGSLDFGETFEACARRELFEETGLACKNVVQGFATNNVAIEDGMHYITVVMYADYVAGEPKLAEPEKCDGWQWFDFDKLPHPLFLPFRNFLLQRERDI